MSDLELEALYRLRDSLEWVVTALPAYTNSTYAREEIREYHRILGRLGELGLDVREFQIFDPMFSGPSPETTMSFVNYRVKAAQRFVARELERREGRDPVQEETPSTMPSNVPPDSIFVVHGRDRDAVETIFALLREVELRPRDFDDARRLTGKALPYVGEVLDAAFGAAQAILVLQRHIERVDSAEK